MKNLLLEYRPFIIENNLIEERTESGDRKLLVSGVLQRVNAKNQNGRVYPRKILEREVDKYMQEFVTNRRALGELDHPDSSVVNLANVSHNIIKIWWDGEDVKGQVEILDTPAGNILKNLFKSGIQLGISSRGLGSVKEVFSEGDDKGTLMVQDDFELIAFDFVSNPSTHGAFLYPVNESVNKDIQNTRKIDSLVSQILCDVKGICSLP
jgi:hypothetical protein